MSETTQPLTDREIEIVSAYVAGWWKDRLRSGDAEAFYDALKASTENQLKERRERPYLSLECDYDPQGALLDTVRAAGLECKGFMFSADGILPRKHSTSIYPARDAEPEFELKALPVRFEAKEGYGNWAEPIPLSEIISAAALSDGGE